MSTQEAALELRVSETTVKRLVRRGTLHATKPKKLRGHWTSFILVDKAFREEQHRRLHGLKAPRRKHIPNPLSRQSSKGAAADNPNLNLNPSLDPSPIQTVTPEEEAEEKCRNAMNICLEAQKACDKDMQECRSLAAECKGESAHVDEVADACRLHKDSALKSAAHVDEMNNAIRDWRDQEGSYYDKCEMVLRVCREIEDKVDEKLRRCKELEESISKSHTMTDTWVNKWIARLDCSEGVYTRCTAVLATACILQLLLATACILQLLLAAYYTLCHFNII